jgi:glycogen phosphorylase
LYGKLVRALRAVQLEPVNPARSRSARTGGVPATVSDAWPKLEISDVDSTGLPDTPLLGSELTLTATVQLAGLRPDEVAVQAVLGRVDGSDVIINPVHVPMAHSGTGDGANEISSTTAPLPVAGSVGYTVRVLSYHPLLADDSDLGLVTLA